MRLIVCCDKVSTSSGIKFQAMHDKSGSISSSGEGGPDSDDMYGKSR